MPVEVRIIGLTTLPEIKTGDDLGELIVSCAAKEGVEIEDGDVVVVSSKVVSKAEGRVVNLSSVKPSPRALRLAKACGKDPRLVEVIIRESREVLKVAPGKLIVVSRLGSVCANAGVDRSNVEGSEEVAVLLPLDPDASARRIRERIRELTGRDVAVVITDTQGRPFRLGQVDVAIGVAGLDPFRDYRGLRDLKGYVLKVKRIALADEVAAAADLVKGGGSEGVPVAIVKGLKYGKKEGASARELNRPKRSWLFR